MTTMSCSATSASVAPTLARANAAHPARATTIARAANPAASRTLARLSSRVAEVSRGLALSVAAGANDGAHARRISVLVEARGRGRRGGGGRRGRGRRPWRRDMNSGPPRNEELDLPEARIIDEDKEFVGVMSTDEAMVIAEEAGLDLVLVSPDANPPVCRIMNYSKFKYENEKKARETRGPEKKARAAARKRKAAATEKKGREMTKPPPETSTTPPEKTETRTTRMPRKMKTSSATKERAKR